MNIKYNIIEEDYIALNMHLFKKSKTMRRQYVILQWMGPVFFFICTLYTHFFLDMPLILMAVLYTIAGVLWYKLYPKRAEKNVRKRLKRVLREKEYTSLYCDYSLTVNDDGIEISSDYATKMHKWSIFRSLDVTDQYIYLLTSEASSIFIPKHAFGSEEKIHEFLSLIKDHI